MSIIVPVYNVEKYLPETIQSVLCQHFEHYEAIFVNDASTDSCPSLLNKTQQEHPQKIKVIHLKENRGLLYARKIGVQHATGKFISFLDGDDTFLPHAFETMACEMHKNPADILRFDNPQTNNIVGCDAILQNIFVEQKSAWNLWNVLFEKNLIKQVYQESSNAHIVICEDIYTMLIAAHFAKQLAFSKKRIYNYRQNSGITTYAHLNPAIIHNGMHNARSIFDSLNHFAKKQNASALFQQVVQTQFESQIFSAAKAFYNLFQDGLNQIFPEKEENDFYLFGKRSLYLAPLPVSRAEKLGKFLLFPFIQLRNCFFKIKKIHGQRKKNFKKN